MTLAPARWGPRDPSERRALTDLLLLDPCESLFLLGLLPVVRDLVPRRTAPSPLEPGFVLVPDGPVFRGVVLSAAGGRLAVPYLPHPGDAPRVAEVLLRDERRPNRLVGGRSACDALLHALQGDRVPAVRTLSRLYELLPGAARAPADPLPARRAVIAEVAPLVAMAIDMHREDLGRDPPGVEDGTYGQYVAARIRDGRTWVGALGNELVFKADLGVVCRHGVQLEGIYVPPRHRGRGLARRTLAWLCADLLARYPRVTLHVREDNLRAVALYEALGFQGRSPFRILVA